MVEKVDTSSNRQDWDMYAPILCWEGESYRDVTHVAAWSTAEVPMRGANPRQSPGSPSLLPRGFTKSGGSSLLATARLAERKEVNDKRN